MYKKRKKKIQRLLYNTISNRAYLAMPRTEEMRPFAFVPSYQWPQVTVFSLILCLVAAKKVQEMMAIYFIHFKFIIIIIIIILNSQMDLFISKIKMKFFEKQVTYWTH